HAAHGLLHRLEAREVAADDLEASVAAGEVEVGAATGGEIVEPPPPPPLGEEPLDDVGADETRSAGHQEECWRRHEQQPIMAGPVRPKTNWRRAPHTPPRLSA